jgi:hypothetical protein
MTNRREVIQAGIAVSAISVTGVAASVSADAAPGAADALAALAPLRLDGVLFDRRFAPAAQMARTVSGYGAPLYETDGDATGIYYQHLRSLWRGPHAAFAGISSIDTTFVFQTLAADHRLRLIYRGLHEAPAGGTVAHTLSGPASVIDAAGLGGYRGAWLQRVGYLMAHCSGAGPVRTIEVSTDAGQAGLREHPREHPMVSWIVAPASWNLAAVGLRTLMNCGGMYGRTA